VPRRAFLVRGAVAHREDEIEVRRVGTVKLRDVLGPEPRDVVALVLEDLHGEGVQLGLRFRAGGMHIEPAAAEVPQQRFGENRPGGISGANEEHAKGVGGHRIDSGVLEGVQGRAQIGPSATAIVEEVAEGPADASMSGA
jgi:hypothetical protein